MSGLPAQCEREDGVAGDVVTYWRPSTAELIAAV